MGSQRGNMSVGDYTIAATCGILSPEYIRSSLEADIEDEIDIMRRCALLHNEQPSQIHEANTRRMWELIQQGYYGTSQFR